MTTALAVLVAVVIGGGYIFYRVSQDQYYVAANGGQVVIYRGINYRILGISLFSLHARTGIPLAQVPANFQQTVLNPEGGGSLSQAQTDGGEHQRGRQSVPRRVPGAGAVGLQGNYLPGQAQAVPG